MKNSLQKLISLSLSRSLSLSLSLSGKDCAPELSPGSVPPAYKATCEVIRKRDGPLRDCARLLDAEQYYGDCVFDMTLTNGKADAACDIISDYVDDCQQQGGTVEDWRSKNFCCKN